MSLHTRDLLALPPSHPLHEWIIRSNSYRKLDYWPVLRCIYTPEDLMIIVAQCVTNPRFLTLLDADRNDYMDILQMMPDRVKVLLWQDQYSEEQY